MPVTVRPATSGDVAVITEFNRRLAEETEDKALDEAVVRAGVAAALADPAAKGPYFVAEDGGAVVGQVQITYEWSDWRNGWFWWIQGVYVRHEARGRGVFRALYGHVVSLARADPSVIGLRLYVETDNTPAQQTYERLGMVKMPYYLYERRPMN